MSWSTEDDHPGLLFYFGQEVLDIFSVEKQGQGYIFSKETVAVIYIQYRDRDRDIYSVQRQG